MHRRDFLKRSAASVAALTILPGCGDGVGNDDVGDNFGLNPESGPELRQDQVFRHGIASGDPLADRVILWTRISGIKQASTIGWEVATDPEFINIVRSANDGVDVASSDTVSSAQDYTFKVDVVGLAPYTQYFYRFVVLGVISPTGRTQTAAQGSLDRLRLAVVTCADFSRGLWNAYARVAERDDIDAVVHLGDYIYETDRDAVRAHQPPVEIRNLDEYRARYQSYRLEPELQALHARHPMIWVWDDHETVDGTWMNGADPSNHNPEEDGPFADRKLAARTAAFEWLPIRLPEPETNPERIYRRFAFGDLVDLTMLDTRRIGRDEQGQDGGIFRQAGVYTDPRRHILGAEQEQWFIDGLNNNTAQWQLIGNQVVFAQIKALGAPNASNLSLFANPDQWDGYSPARDRIFDALEASPHNNFVFLTGDVHAALAFEITRDPNNPLTYLPRTGLGTLGVEFVSPSISSAGDVDGLLPSLLQLLKLRDLPDTLEDIATSNGDLLRLVNPHGQYFDSRNGYMIIDVDRERVQGEFWLVPTVTAATDKQSLDAAFVVPDGQARLKRVSPLLSSASTSALAASVTG